MALCIGYLLIQLFVNGRFGMLDFEVYYKAGERLLNGENLYRRASLEAGGDGFFRYKYAPTAAFYFIPFSILPFKIAGILYWVVLSFILAHICWLSYQHFTNIQANQFKQQPWLMLLAAIILGVHIEAEFNLGQVNMLLLWLYVLTARLWLNNKASYWVALPWAISIFLKPYALIFLPFFLWYRNYKLIVFWLAWLLLLTLVILPFYGNIEFWWIQQLEWLREISIEFTINQDLKYARNNPTIFAVLVRYTPLFLLEWRGTSLKLLQLIVLAIMGILGIGWLSKRRRSTITERWIEWALLLPILPLIALSSTNLFILLYPLVLGLLLCWHRLHLAYKIIAIIGMILQGLNIRDLWGAWAPYWDQLGIVGLGGLVLVLVWFLVYQKPLQKQRE